MGGVVTLQWRNGPVAFRNCYCDQNEAPAKNNEISQHPFPGVHELRFSRDKYSRTWWRHQMETFSASLAICAGNSPVPGEFPAQRPVTQKFDVFFDLRPNKRLSKQSWSWWFETQSRPLWRHRNVRSQANEQQAVLMHSNLTATWTDILVWRSLSCNEK